MQFYPIKRKGGMFNIDSAPELFLRHVEYDFNNTTTHRLDDWMKIISSLMPMWTDEVNGIPTISRGNC